MSQIQPSAGMRGDPPRTRGPAQQLVRITCVLAVGALCAALAACGGSGANAAAQERTSALRAEAQVARFARCLREHGIKAEGNASGGQATLKVTGPPGAGGGADRQTFEAAQKACQRYRPSFADRVKLSPQERVKREEAVLHFAKCMREHGIDLHASASEHGIRIGIHRGPGSGGPNPASPAFEAAQKACQGLLPFKGRPPGAPKGAVGFAVPGG